MFFVFFLSSWHCMEWSGNGPRIRVESLDLSMNDGKVNVEGEGQGDS